MSSPAASIDDLPAEMLRELFRHLSPINLAACSMVNKRWHSIYSSIKLLRLAAINHYPYYKDQHPGYWWHSNQPVRAEERCMFEQFFRLADRPLLSNLKHLVLWGWQLEFDISAFLNRFDQTLLHLEIRVKYLDNKVNLNLPRLKTLSLYEPNYDGNCSSSSIDCPQLRGLAYYEMNGGRSLLDVKHPETIRLLETDMSGPKLAQFRNVDCLVTDNFEVLSRTTLLLLPRLKEVRYSYGVESLFFDVFKNEFDALDRMKRALREFMDAVRALRGSDFRFSFAGFTLSEALLDRIDFGVLIEQDDDKESTAELFDEYIYMKNHRLIGPDQALEFMRVLRYELLIDSGAAEVPMSFFRKFTGVLVASYSNKQGAIQDADHFLGFLKSLPSLRRLSLYCPQLSQDLLDRLPATACSLINLELGQDDNQQLNFDFISKFEHLKWLYIGYALPFVCLATLNWQVLEELEECRFYFESKKNSFRVRKFALEKWIVSDKHDRPKRFICTENAAEIVSFFKEELRADEEEASSARQALG